VKFRTAWIATTLVFAACAALSLAAQKKPAPAPASSLLAADKGKFTIKLGGQTVGHEEFEIAPSGGGWLAKGTADIKPPEGPASKVTGSLTLQADGAPISYDWTSQAEKTNGAHVLFVNGVAKITLEVQGARPFEQNLTFNSPLIAVLDNNLYHQYAVLARIYDWSRGGDQTFPVLIPQELTPGTITVKSAGSASADGKTYEGLKVISSDLEILLLLDKNHRLIRLEVPDAKVSVIRE
jgi:hypothetical protein